MRRGRLFLLLGFLIAVGGALALLFFLQTPTTPPAAQAPPTPVPLKRVVAARIDIPNNTVISDTETFLTLQEIPEPEYNAAPNTYFTSVGELLNMLTLRQINATEIIRRDMVTEPGLSQQIPPADTPDEPRPKAYPLQVNNLSGVADQITQGDFVDVVMTFEVQRTIIRPSLTTDPTTGQLTLTVVEEPFTGRSTKTLVQNAQVLQILKPQPPEGEGTPTAQPAGPPATGPDGQPVTDQTAAGADTFVPGSWLLLLALTDQEVEILEFARTSNVPITLVLRGRGDTAVEDTAGATFDILVRQFGLPLPEPAPPAPIAQEALTPQPTPSTP
ncbi:MAG TPA: Flp pilus assembly protein CpaB [Roseiflexaceae bacterium]|nr:Flp pilus assembly protein CpaB [Roseiflexaceae bacterium]